jgi:hypothetical protein
MAELEDRKQSARRSLYTIVRRCRDCPRRMEFQSLQHEKVRCDDCQRKRQNKLALRRYKRMKRENPEAWAKLQAYTKKKNAANAARRKAKYVPHPRTPEMQREIIRQMADARDAKREKKIPRWNGESPDTVKAANPAYENGDSFQKFVKQFVICRICGKLVGSIAAHLKKNAVHSGIDLAEYKRLYPRAPIYSLKVKKRNRDWHNADNRTHPQRSAGFRANRKARINRALQKGWRPDNWKDWSADERLVAIMLIEDPNMGNREIGINLDESRFRCSFGETWERALTKPGSGATWIYRTRLKLRDARSRN